ncbi:MAG TPA: glycosyltransferase family 9 protein, partial [Edaphobacter sp.]
MLIYRLGSLGDTLIALPALNLVARAFPHADRRMLTNFPVNVKAPPAAAILDHTNLIHGFFRYSVGTRSPIELAKLWWTIASWRPNVLVYLAAKRGVAAAQRDAKFFRLCGIKKLIGIPLTEEMQKNLPQPTYDSLEPEAERLVRNISSLGDGRLNDPANWDLHLTDAEVAKADAALGRLVGMPLIAVSVGTKVQSKDWGRDNWRALLSEIARTYPGYGLAL